MRVRSGWMLRHPIQAKYLLIVLLAMVAPTFVIGFGFYNLVFNMLALQMAFPEAISANLIPVIERVNHLLLIVLPILALIILWFGLAISHRFAGPIERLESELDHILEGDLSHRIQTRKRDDLKGVVQRINKLLDKLRPVSRS